MKRFVLFVVALVFVFCATVMAADKAAALVKEEPIKVEAVKTTPEKVAPAKTKGAAEVKAMSKSDKKSEKALKKGGKDVRELDTKSQTNGAKH